MGVIVNKNGALKNTTEGSFYETVGMDYLRLSSTNSRIDSITLDWAPKLLMILMSESTATSFAVVTDTCPITTVPIKWVTGSLDMATISIDGTTLNISGHHAGSFIVYFYFK